MNDLKVIFMGTPDFSVPVLDMLINNTNVLGVVTQPDKPVGRTGKISISPVKELALKNNLKVFQPERIKNEYKDILDLNPDIIITCAYGQMIPMEVLDYPRLGSINVHASLLPYHRGGAPIHRAIIDGDSKSGITIMYMGAGMDSGDIISQREVDILDSDTAESLFDKLSILGSELLKDTLPSIIEGTNDRIKQDESKATYSYNIKPEDEIIDFNKNKRDVFNQIRGLNSWPVAYTYLDGKRLKVWLSRIGDSNKDGEIGEIINIYKDGIGIKVLDGEIVLTEIQPEGKKKMKVLDYLNGLGEKKKELIGKRVG
jgi:methionyl-tRNA formyltransferase